MVGEGPGPRRHATLPQSWIQRENWEFETHSLVGDWPGVPYLNQFYRPGWQTRRTNTFAYLKADWAFSDVTSLRAGFYVHRTRGRGDWLPPFIVDVTDDGAGRRRVGPAQRPFSRRLASVSGRPARPTSGPQPTPDATRVAGRTCVRAHGWFGTPTDIECGTPGAGNAIGSATQNPATEPSGPGMMGRGYRPARTLGSRVWLPTRVSSNGMDADTCCTTATTTGARALDWRCLAAGRWDDPSTAASSRIVRAWWSEPTCGTQVLSGEIR